jgi:hypothetical protein
VDRHNAFGRCKNCGYLTNLGPDGECGECRLSRLGWGTMLAVAGLYVLGITFGAFVGYLVLFSR